jgi:protein-tyrosine phosphatase
MLEMAILQGITHVACTPHSNDRSGAKANEAFQSAFKELSAEITRIELPVEITLASEIMFGANIEKLFSFPFATYSGKGKYFLVEFPTETPFEIILNVIRSAQRWKKRPVIAHYERYDRACRSKDQAEQIRDAGGIITLDAGSLVGQFGRPMLKRSKELMEWGVVDILCSDAHNDDDHRFILREGFEAAAKIIGEPTARLLVVDHPRRVWNGDEWPGQ